jgi:hypothetical protein
MTMTETAPVPTAAGDNTPTAASEDRRLRALEAQVRDLDRRVENTRIIRDTWTIILFVLVAVALLASIIAVGFGMRAIDEAEHHVAAAMPLVAAGVA